MTQVHNRPIATLHALVRKAQAKAVVLEKRRQLNLKPHRQLMANKAYAEAVAHNAGNVPDRLTKRQSRLRMTLANPKHKNKVKVTLPKLKFMETPDDS